METFSALLATCAGNSLVPGEFPAQRHVTQSFHAFYDLRLNKPFSKQSWGWWFDTLVKIHIFQSIGNILCEILKDTSEILHKYMLPIIHWTMKVFDSIHIFKNLDVRACKYF